MADTKVVNAGENTPEEIAFKLFREIALVENKKIIYINGADLPNRAWILDTYAECLDTVQNPNSRLQSAKKRAS